jgi:septal ring factor EnvC (AmiA/AmiB activator)
VPRKTLEQIIASSEANKKELIEQLSATKTRRMLIQKDLSEVNADLDELSARAKLARRRT